MDKKRKVSIGLDIGITSVGWAIVDEDNNIIDRGVRLFEELKIDGVLKNQERREKRHQRRTIRRKINRKDDFIKMITKDYFNIFGIKKFDDFIKTKENFLKIIDNVKSGVEKSKHITLDLILKGLEGEIKPLELVKVLYYYLSHRGFSYMTIEQFEKKNKILNLINENNEMKEFAKWLETNDKKENQKLIEEKVKKINFKNIGINRWDFFVRQIKTYNKEKEFLNNSPSVIQKKEFDKYGYLRGNNEINGSFSKFEWEKEIKQILNNQNYLNNEFKNKYLEIFNRLRDFAKGPGSEKSPTDYGLWRKNSENKIIKEKDNLWDFLIGKCSIFPDENRTNKKSCSAEIANILSQLNTIVIKDNDRENSNGKLTQQEKETIIFNIISSSKKQSKPLEIISKVCKTNSNNIFGYPTKKSKKLDKSIENENLEKLENTKTLFNWLKNLKNINNFNDLLDNKELFNEIIDIFAKYPKDLEGLERELINNPKIDLDIETINEIINENKIDSKSTSSMSLKALDLYINDELRTNGLTINQKYKELIEQNELKRFNFGSESKYINVKSLDNSDFRVSPTVICSYRETLKILNKIFKRYVYNPSNKYNETFEVKSIVLEMPTEWNSKDEKERLTSIENYKKELKEKVKDLYNYDGKNDEIVKKLVLYNSQNRKDIYTNEIMDEYQIIHNPNYCEIDHIIPYAISYDNSINNLVLVLRGSNQWKEKQTPKEFLDNKKYNEMVKEWEKMFLDNKNDKNYNKKKFNNLTIDFGSNELKYKRKLGFIGRNLSDTRYTCRIIKQLLDKWIGIEKNQNRIFNGKTNIITINGKQTHRYRSEKFLNIPKNRKDYSHHAIDATICAYFGNDIETIDKINNWYINRFSKTFVNHLTGEVLDKKSFDDLVNNSNKKPNIDNLFKRKDIKEKIENVDDIKFSYKINKKNNFGFWNDSIISIKNDNDKYFEYKKLVLLDNNGQKIEKIFKELINDKTNIVKKFNPMLWKNLTAAFNEGLKIKENNIEYKNENPFKLYMSEYCRIFNKGNPDKYNSLFLKNDNNVEYTVKEIKYLGDEKQVFNVTKKTTTNANKFGAFVGMNWKEIRLFKDNKDKYKIIPLRINMYKNYKNNELDLIKYKNLLKKFNIFNEKFYVIHKNSLLINKNNQKDIRRIVGGKFERQNLEIKEIIKETPKELRDKNVKSINTIMENYWFCNIDELGNIDILKELPI